MDIKIGDTVLVGNVCYDDFHDVGTRDWVYATNYIVSTARELADKCFVVNNIEKSFYFKDCYFVSLLQESERTTRYAHIPIKALIKVNTAEEMPFDDDSQSELQSFIDSFVHK